MTTLDQAKWYNLMKVLQSGFSKLVDNLTCEGHLQSKVVLLYQMCSWSRMLLHHLLLLKQLYKLVIDRQVDRGLIGAQAPAPFFDQNIGFTLFFKQAYHLVYTRANSIFLNLFRIEWLKFLYFLCCKIKTKLAQ